MSKSVLTSLLLTAVICGCGRTLAPPEPVYPVTGVVTYKGQPVVGADLTFFNAEKKRSAFGRTNDKGEYKLTTFSANDGAVEGRSIMVVTKYVPPQVTAPEPDIESEAYQPPGYGVQTPVKSPALKSEVPARYADQATSGLIAVVTKEGPNKVDVELAD